MTCLNENSLTYYQKYHLVTKILVTELSAWVLYCLVNIENSSYETFRNNQMSVVGLYNVVKIGPYQLIEWLLRL